MTTAANDTFNAFYGTINDIVYVTNDFPMQNETATFSGDDESSGQLNNEDNVELAIYITFEVCIAILAFINNLLVVVAVFKFHSLRSPTNWFVASLAVADIAVAVFAIPSAILLRFGISLKVQGCDAKNGLIVTSSMIPGTSVSQGVCFAIVSSVIFLTQVSIFSLLVIAIDRFIAINYPFRYGTFMTSNKTRFGILAVWGLGALIGIAPEVGWNKLSQNGNSCNITRCAFEDVISMEYMVYFNFFGCVLTPLIAMGVIYLLIFRSAKKQLQKIYSDVSKIKRHKSSDSRSRDSSPQRHNRTAARLTSLSNGYLGNAAENERIPCRITFSLPLKRPSWAQAVIRKNIDLDEESPTTTSKTSNGFLPTEGDPQAAENVIDPEQRTSAEIERDNYGLTSDENVRKSNSVGNIHAVTNYSEDTQGVTNSLIDISEIKPTAQSKARELLRRIYSRNTFSLGDIYQGNIINKDSPSAVNNNLLKPERTDTCDVTMENGNALRPHGKAHSFTASSSIVRIPSDHRRAFYQIRATPLSKLSNGHASSVTSSRSTVFTSEHGVWSSSFDSRSHQFSYKMKRKSELLKKEFRAARSLATVVGIFALCWLPLHILNTLTLFCPTCTQPMWIKDIAILLSHANSLINPLIYAFKLKDFKTAFRKILAGIMSSPGRYCDARKVDSRRSGKRSIFRQCCFAPASRNKSVDFGMTSEERSSLSDRRPSILKQKFADRSNNNNARKIYRIEESITSPRQTSWCVNLNCLKRKHRAPQSRKCSRFETEMTSAESWSPSGECENMCSMTPSTGENTGATSTVFFPEQKSETELFTALLNSNETAL